MSQVGDTLLIHADSLLYTRYGKTVKAVNTAFRRILEGDDAEHWDRMLGDFSDRMAFFGKDVTEESTGALASERFLQKYGDAARLVHGHTPIGAMAGQTPESVTEAFVYAKGRCVNVDHCLYNGGSGFVYKLPAAS